MNNPNFSFSKGKRYSVSDSGNSTKSHSSNMNPSTGQGCVFVYMHKEGKHHIFRNFAAAGHGRTQTFSLWASTLRRFES